MNKIASLEKMLNIIETKGVVIKVEDRTPWNHYGFPKNHAEVLDYINSADGDLWDTMIFGYNKPFVYNDHYKTRELLGMIWSPTGNHKLLVKLPYIKGFSEKKFKKDVKKYIKAYKNLNKLNIYYIDYKDIMEKYDWS